MRVVRSLRRGREEEVFKYELSSVRKIWLPSLDGRDCYIDRRVLGR